MKNTVKQIYTVFLDAVPHLSLVLSLMHVTFLIVDLFNRAMAFVNNDITKWLLVISAILMLILCSDLHKNAKSKPRPARIGLRVCVVTSVLTLFVFILDRETKVINTTTVKYMLYIYAIASASLSVYGIHYRRKLIQAENAY